MRNQTEVQKSFKKFHKELRDIAANNNNEKLWKSFTRWWVGAKYPEASNVWLTGEQGDGKIDAVVELPSNKFAVIQAKYNDKYQSGKASNVKRVPGTGSNSHEPFDTIVIPAFEDQQSFDKYVVDQKIEPVKAGIYRKAFEARQKDFENISFEFITTYDEPSDIKNAFTYLRWDMFSGIDQVIHLYRLEIEGKNPPAKPLELHFEKSFKQYDKEFGILSWIIKADLSDLVIYMQKHYRTGVPAIISENIRTLVSKPHKKGDVTYQILQTYTKTPEEFWFSHNGITMICHKIMQLDENHIQLIHPNIINGAQTVMALREATKVHTKGNVLIRIYEIEGGPKTKELIKNIIYRTNRQTAIGWHNLRALEPSQLTVSKYFFKMGVYYQKRDGEHALVRHTSKYSGLAKCRIQDLTQTLKIAKDGADGVYAVKQSRQELFKDDDEFKELFNIEVESIFFQFVVQRMITHIFSRINKSRKGYLLSPVYGIFWDAIKSIDLRKYEKWEKVVNDKKGKILDVKARKKSEAKSLKTLINKMFNSCDDIRKEIQRKENIQRKQAGKDETVLTLSIFANTKSLEPNRQAFKMAKQKYHAKIIKEIDRFMKTYQEY